MDTNYNFAVLENHIINTIKESQLKIGYTPNSVTLNYPPESVSRMIGAKISELPSVLDKFSEYASPRLGRISFSLFEGRYAITVPAEGADYVNKHIKPEPFIEEWINAVKTPGKLSSIEDVLSVFQKHSDSVVCTPADSDEFQYAVYFSDGNPDDFVYCIDSDFGIITYHRFSKDDYTAMGFSLK